jgi:hypothetical protein
VKKIFVLSTEGYIIKINNKPVESRELMSIDFNGRNLTVSFFAPKKLLFNLESPLMTEYGEQDNDENQLVFVEIECENIEAKMKNPNSDKVLLQVEIKVAKIMHLKNNNSIEQRIFGFQTISFVIVDNEHKIKCFMDVFYNRYKMRERMSLDENNSLLEQESLMSYNTNASMLSNVNDTLPPRNYIKIECPQQTEPLDLRINIKDDKKLCKQTESKAIKTIDKSKDAKIMKNQKSAKVEVKVAQKVPAKRGRKPTAVKVSSATQEPQPTRPKRQSAKKINYKDQFDLPASEEMPSYREFIHKKREERSMASQISKVAANDQEDDEEEEEEQFVPKPQAKIVKKLDLKTKPTVTSTAIVNVERRQKRSRHEAFKNDDVFDFPRAPLKQVQANSKKSPPKKPESVRKITQLAVAPLKRLKTYEDKDEDDDMDVDTYDSNQDNKVVVKNENTRFQPKDQVSEFLRSRHLESWSHNVRKIAQQGKIEKQQENTQQAKRQPEELPPYVASKPNQISFVHPSEIQAIAKKRRLAMENIDCNTTTSSSKQMRIAEWIEKSSSQLNIGVEMDVNITDNSQNEESDEQIDVVSEPDKTDHQYYASSLSQAESDSNVKMKHHVIHFDSSFNPFAVFRERSLSVVGKFKSNFEKVTRRKKELDKDCDPVIKKLAESHLVRVQEAKVQFNTVMQLNKHYMAAKGKLVEALEDKEESSKKLKVVLGKRRHLYNSSKQTQFKELTRIRQEVNETRDGLKQEIWREYVDDVHKKMLNSFKEAMEI